jgi:hypothetical protein
MKHGLGSHTCPGNVCLRYCQGCFYHCHAAQQLVGLYASALFRSPWIRFGQRTASGVQRLSTVQFVGA